MDNFQIEQDYITDVRVEFKQLNEDGATVFGTFSHVDHPSFTALREHLGARGYISIERRWWNGDRVLTPFKLNGMVFNVGDKFSSSSALAVKFSCITNKLYSDREEIELK